MSPRIADLISGVLDRVVELRLRRRVVLWGGRPGRDLQVGSAEDRKRQATLNRYASLRVNTTPILAAVRIFGREMARVAAAYQQAFGRPGVGVGLAEALEAQRTQPGVPLEEAVANLRRARARKLGKDIADLTRQVRR
jgi:hypothetical protein